ncbi:phage regulatory protein Rha [Desulfosporosinus acididurans]|uniref:Phage regulatory protein Rha n=1 Tax=Desulfosporosinus acididurans TaxID=476652 RepID=A0A0J1ILX0_9FIRM|nr:Rha family transcriptional regulator [Desulfosporosinus acididurans]KLU65701.1 phage regulatory protein Rha [Desulfosporosinus acididurans]
MSHLTVTNQDGVLVVDSRDAAQMLVKRHSDLLEKIDGYIRYLENGELRSQDFFIESAYSTSGNNRRYKHYFLTRKGCELVANKMTGEKGVLFTAAYVTKFNDMEKALLNSHQQILNEAKRMRSEAMLLNAKTKQTRIITDLAIKFQEHLSPESVQSLLAGVSAYLFGSPLLPMPEIEKTYTASQIAEDAGVSRFIIGKLAHTHGLKKREFGLWVLNTIPSLGKQLPHFRYNEKGKSKLLELMEQEGAVKP